MYMQFVPGNNNIHQKYTLIKKLQVTLHCSIVIMFKIGIKSFFMRKRRSKMQEASLLIQHIYLILIYLIYLQLFIWAHDIAYKTYRFLKSCCRYKSQTNLKVIIQLLWRSKLNQIVYWWFIDRAKKLKTLLRNEDFVMNCLHSMCYLILDMGTTIKALGCVI